MDAGGKGRGHAELVVVVDVVGVGVLLVMLTGLLEVFSVVVDDDGLVLFAGETVLLIADSSLSGFSTVSVSVKRPGLERKKKKEFSISLE